MAKQQNIHQVKPRTRVKQAWKVVDQASQTDLKEYYIQTFQSMAACPLHGPQKVCTCLDKMQQKYQDTRSVTIEKPSSSRTHSLQTQTVENETHTCSVRIEPTTSCESHFGGSKKVITASRETATSKKYEADDEKSSADTLKTLRKFPHQTHAKYQIEKENSDESFRQKSTQTPKHRSRTPSRMIDDSSEELVALRSSSKSRKVHATEISRSPSRRRSKSRTYKVVENKKTSSDDGMDPICSAASGNISVPHICTRRKHPCNESCTTHVIKEIDEETRVCACAKKHPDLFSDIKKAK